MKAFIAYRHTGADLTGLKPLLQDVCDALAASGMTTYCTLINQDEFTSRAIKPHEIMKHAFRAIDDSDFLFVLQTSEEKSEGMLMEVGYCIAKGIPVIVATQEEVSHTYLPDMANFALTWKTPDDLIAEIEAANFADVLS